MELAAYRKLVEEHLLATKNRVPPFCRYVLHLPKDGGEFQFKPLTDLRDWGMFQARMYQFNYLRAA